MRLTTKGRFAVTAMIDVALNGRCGPVNLSSIHQRQRISLSYLEHLFGKLRREGLVDSTRGPGGGYSLSRQASDISVADIIQSIDDGADLKGRRQNPDIPGAVHPHTTDALWESVNRRAVEFLQSVTLQSLVDEQISKGVQAAGKVRAKVSPARVKAPPVNAPNSVFAMGALLAKR